MKNFIFICAVMLYTTVISAQGDGLVEAVRLDYDEKHQPIVQYKVSPEETLYKASKIYDVSVSKILRYNNLQSANDIPKGATLNIPIDKDIIYRAADLKGVKHTQFIPLHYQVKPKETLFRIAKVYAGQSVELMMKRNGMSAPTLEIGQDILIGWIPVDSKTKHYFAMQTQKENDNITSESNQNVPTEIVSTEAPSTEEDSLMAEMPMVHVKQQKGIAIWNKSSKGTSRFALHPTAKINSEIELYNPMLRRSVRAKVVGRIPDGTYQEDVDVILSPATAVSLGALDSRFKVVMKYTE